MLPNLSVLWVIALVLVLTFVLDRFLFRPITRVMQERARRIESAEELAEASAAQAEAAAREFEDKTTAARTELYRQMAWLGVPYLMDIDIKMGGEGPVGALMGKLGFGFTSTVTRVSVEAIPYALMAVPADYKVKRN